MSTHGIILPRASSATATGIAPISRALTVEPKEVAIAAGGAISISIDLGAAVEVDSFFIGFTNDGGAGSLQLSRGNANAFETAIGAAMGPASTALSGARRHFFRWLDDPVTARFIGIAGVVPAGFQIGVIAVGKAFCPGWGPEWGGGRGVIDTGSATRRLDGGFGIVRGARAGSWQWTLGDLTDAEREQLYAVAFEVGETGTLLVVEDMEAAGAQAEKLHWSILRRIEPYERRDPDMNRWSLKLEDWA